MTVLPFVTSDQRAVAAIAQVVLDVDAGRRPGWMLDQWGIGHLRASGRPHAHVVSTVVQRRRDVVHAVALYERRGRVRAMTLTVRAGRVLHVQLLEDDAGAVWALPDPIRQLRSEVA